MNIVEFPGLNLKFEVSEIAFSIMGIEIYKYACCIVFGIVISLILCKLNNKNFDIKLENMIIGIIFGIIGARIYYILFNYQYYIQNINKIFNIRDGGLAIYGGLIGGAIAIIINCKVKKIDILDFFDYIIPYVALAQCFGRFGNFFNIEAYGSETNVFCRMKIQTINGYKQVHPVFLYESICTFMIFFVLIYIQKKRKYKGQIILLYLLYYSAIRMFLEALRIDSLMFFNWRISQVLSILIFLISLCVIVCRKLSNEKTLKY